MYNMVVIIFGLCAMIIVPAIHSTGAPLMISLLLIAFVAMSAAAIYYATSSFSVSGDKPSPKSGGCKNKGIEIFDEEDNVDLSSLK